MPRLSEEESHQQSLQGLSEPAYLCRCVGFRQRRGWPPVVRMPSLSQRSLHTKRIDRPPYHLELDQPRCREMSALRPLTKLSPQAGGLSRRV